MTNQGQKPDVKQAAGFLTEVFHQAELVWKLMRSKEVPTWVKFIPPVAIVYLLSPIDFIPDPMLGLGQLDDLAILLLSLKLFVELCPPIVVKRLTDEMSDGLSMVYSFYDPELASRSLGTFMILDHIARARALGLPYLYLGYWVDRSKKMGYKARFLPQERLLSQGWVRFE